MRLIVFLVLLFQHSFLFAQMGLPIQQSLLPKRNVVADYDFSKSTSFTRGGTTATNLAGAGSAKIINSPIFFNSLGFVSLNGTNQYLMSPNLRSFFKSLNSSVQKSFTMSMWIYPIANNGVIVVELDSESLGAGFHATNIELVNGLVYYRVWNGTAVVSSKLNLNQWYHVAMVYDGSNLKGYLNGVLQGTQSSAREIPVSTQYYGVGAAETTQMGSGGGYGNFNLAQFRIYNLPLSDSDILQEYESRKNEFDYTIHSPLTNANPTYWSVSSVWNSENTFAQQHYQPWLNSALGWAALNLNTSQFITLNYDEPAIIKGIVVQGRAYNGGQWVSKAHIESSMSSSGPWTRIVSNATVNSNSLDDVRILFPNSVVAKYIRVIPLDWNNHITMRFGLLVKPITFTPDASLVLHFNPGSLKSYSGSGTTITNLTGNGLNGTLSSITFTDPYFDFNGSSSQISIADNELIEPGNGNWTMEAWFKSSNIIGGKVVLGKFRNGGSASDVSYSIRISNANLFAQIGPGSTNIVNSTSYAITANTWYQVVYVFKPGQSLETFINGQSIGSVVHSVPSILNMSNPLYLGRYNGGEYAQNFSGQIGIVRLYKKALSAAEVQSNFDNYKANYGL